MKTTIQPESVFEYRKRTGQSFLKFYSQKVWKRVRRIVLELSGYKCWNCGVVLGCGTMKCHEVVVDGRLLGFMCLCAGCHKAVEFNRELVPPGAIIKLESVFKLNK